MSWLNANGSVMKEMELLEMKASHALIGIPPSEIADKMEYCEKQRENWVEQGSRNWFKRITRAWAARVMRGLLQIHRTELFELAITVAKQQNDARAAVSQADTYRQFVRLVGDNREYRAFLYEHFGNDLAQADAMNQPLLELTKGMLLKFKYGNDYHLPGLKAEPNPSSEFRAGEPV
jgi:hypothetical protein